MVKDRKTLLIIGAVIAVIFIVGATMIFRGRQDQNGLTNETLPEQEVIPTVDSSVKVDLEAANRKGEVILTIDNAPAGTKTAEYVLTYDASEQGEQGAIGKCEFTGGKRDCEKQVTLGTCSSGTCVYHDVVGPIKLEVRFSGSYGDKIFEGEFKI